MQVIPLTKENTFRQSETRTSATVFTEDLRLFKAIARLKFKSDPMNNAWKEAVTLFIRENKDLLKETYDKIDSSK